MRFIGGGGGVVARTFFFSVVSKRHFPLMGPFWIFFTFPKGGAPWAPPESATVPDLPLFTFSVEIFFTFTGPVIFHI